MNPGLYAIVSGANSLLTAMDIVANNLANANTTAFKESMPVFKMVRSAAPTPARSGIGITEPSIGLDAVQVKFAFIHTNYAPGLTVKTDSPLDLALKSEGFFVLRDPESDELRFTRQGEFTLNSKGQLVNLDGQLVLGNRGPITLGTEEVLIRSDGTIEAKGKKVDQLQVVTFKELNALKKEGSMIFSAPETGADLKPVPTVEVLQGFLEKSNVSVARNLVEMISISRAYQAYQKAIEAFVGARGTVSRAANEVGRIA